MKKNAKHVFHALTAASAAITALSASAVWVLVPPKVAAGVTAASAVISAVLHFWVTADPTVDDVEPAK